MNQREKADFTQGSILNKLIPFMMPVLGALVLQAAYGAVDLLVVGRFGTTVGLSAVSTGSQILNLVTFVITQFAMGITVLIARYIGAKKVEQIGELLGGAVTVFTIICIILFVVMVFFANPLAVLMQAPEEALALTSVYVRICGGGIFFIVAYNVLAAIFRGFGDSKSPLIFVAVACIVNIIGDLILVAGFHLDTAGAAIATVIGQIIAGIFAVVLNIKKNKEIHLHLKGFKLEKKYIGRILYVGVPSVLMVAIGSVMSYGMNLILMTFSSTAVAVFGAYYKLQSFVFMPIFGLNNGMVPIVSFNLGAKNKDRLVKTVKLGVCYAVGIMLIGLVIIQAMPGTLLTMFNASEQMLTIGVPALRIISVSFVFAGFSIIASSTFQALGNGILSMLVSFVRQLVFLLPAAFILSKFGNVDLVWLSFPIAEVAAVIMSAISLKYLYNKVVKDL